jgi:hypothetical protein
VDTRGRTELAACPNVAAVFEPRGTRLLAGLFHLVRHPVRQRGTCLSRYSARCRRSRTSPSARRGSRRTLCLDGAATSTAPRGRLARPLAQALAALRLTDGLGAIVVKPRHGDPAGEKTEWRALNLSRLASRGYPVPSIVWHGPIDDQCPRSSSDAYQKAAPATATSVANRGTAAPSCSSRRDGWMRRWTRGRRSSAGATRVGWCWRSTALRCLRVRARARAASQQGRSRRHPDRPSLRRASRQAASSGASRRPDSTTLMTSTARRVHDHRLRVRGSGIAEICPDCEVLDAGRSGGATTRREFSRRAEGPCVVESDLGGGSARVPA